tara:strand:- start:279 stop:482 length:204 start_codon:yes stop_codon:yes gene_type:complete
MNNFTVFLYFLMFAATAGATFAFMWKMTSASLEDMNKPVRKRNIHPEMKDVQDGEELLVFRQQEDET